MYLEGISIFLLPHPPRPLDIETKFCVLTNRTCVACIQKQEKFLQINGPRKKKNYEDVRKEKERPDAHLRLFLVQDDG